MRNDGKKREVRPASSEATKGTSSKEGLISACRAYAKTYEQLEFRAGRRLVRGWADTQDIGEALNWLISARVCGMKSAALLRLEDRAAMEPYDSVAGLDHERQAILSGERDEGLADVARLAAAKELLRASKQIAWMAEEGGNAGEKEAETWLSMTREEQDAAYERKRAEQDRWSNRGSEMTKAQALAAVNKTREVKHAEVSAMREMVMVLPPGARVEYMSPPPVPQTGRLLTHDEVRRHAFLKAEYGYGSVAEREYFKQRTSVSKDSDALPGKHDRGDHSECPIDCVQGRI